MVEPSPSSPFQLDKLALFEDLGYEPHPGQLEVHGSKASRRVMACGVRWGKSTCAAMEAVAAVLEPRAESLGWIVGPTYDLSNLIFRHVLGLLQQHVPHRIEDVNPREHLVRLRNLGGGLSEVRARSADNSDSLLGEGLDWLIVDEAARLRGSIWENHLSQRLIDRRGWALLLSTPRGKGWFYELFRRGQEQRDPHYESWCFPSWTNPYLVREVIELERGRLGDKTFRQEYGAEFIGSGFERCGACGDPDPVSLAGAQLQADEELGECPRCGAPVNGEGRAVRSVMGGRICLNVDRLEFRGERPLAFGEA